MKRLLVISLGVFFMATTSFGQNNQTIEEIEVIAPTFKSEFFKYKSTPQGLDPFTYYINEMILSQAEQMEFRNGKVIIDFVVHKDGTISDFMVANSVSNANDKAVIRALKSTSGFWNPAHNNGISIPMEKRMVVNFIDKEKSSLVELARKSYLSGVKKYYMTKSMESLNNARSSKKIERTLKAALNRFNDATRLYAHDASIVYYELKTYRALNDQQMIVQKEAEYNMLVSESNDKNADYLAINF